MYCEVLCATVAGIGAKLVTVEIDIGEGLPYFHMVGMLSEEVKEARDRVKTAIKNMGISIPPKRITINLSPADIRKDGTGFDLPIAVAILNGMCIISDERLHHTMFVGELSLDGKVNGVSGVLSMVIEGKEQGIQKFFVPSVNAKEAAIVKGVEVFGVHTLNELVSSLNGSLVIEQTKVDFDALCTKRQVTDGVDFSDINGQYMAKRATEIAVAGMHNILYIGPPGTGKSMLATRIPGILPELTFEECLELTKIYSVSGMLSNENLIIKRPFRSIHHNVTSAALTGGGRIPKPGEITLAHKGVLFLDEIPEFRRNLLENLRQPLEDKKLIISRAGRSEEFPADFMLVAAMNPCPCGYFPDRNRCSCTQYSIDKYMNQISGPIMDRIDICINVLPVSGGEMTTAVNQSETADMGTRIQAAQHIQIKRYMEESICYNASIQNNHIKKYCQLGKEETDFMDMSYKRFNLSARGYYRIIKVARTIADLAACEDICTEHLKEAVSLRNGI